jgi:nitrous oxide reductase accessory protein NosL
MSEKRLYTIIQKEKGSIGNTKTQVHASSEKEAKQMIESRGGKVITLYYGKA